MLIVWSCERILLAQANTTEVCVLWVHIKNGDHLFGVIILAK